MVGDEAECSDRLRTAENLIKHLKTEGVDWKNQCTVLKDQLENLPGDSLLTCSAIIYLGPLSSSFRKELLNDWQQILKGFYLSYYHSDLQKFRQSKNI